MSIEKAKIDQVYLEINANLAIWLNYQKSLTAKLGKYVREVHLKVFNEGLYQANWWEQNILQLPKDTLFRREIAIYAGKEPCWYARTMIPYDTYIAEKKLFSRLDFEPLSAIIFNNKDIIRKDFYTYVVNENMTEYYWVKKYIDVHYPYLYVRLSEFLIKQQHHFYLTEVLFQAVTKYND